MSLARPSYRESEAIATLRAAGWSVGITADPAHVQLVGPHDSIVLTATSWCRWSGSSPTSIGTLHAYTTPGTGPAGLSERYPTGTSDRERRAIETLWAAVESSTVSGARP